MRVPFPETLVLLAAGFLAGMLVTGCVVSFHYDTGPCSVRPTAYTSTCPSRADPWP